MLWSVSDVTGYRIAASNREIGTVQDCLFDDRSSETRYVVVDTGGWLPGRLVLIAPTTVTGVAPELKVLEVGLSARQVEESPGLSHDRPVSRQEEIRLHQHHGWAPLWGPLVSEVAGLAPYLGRRGLRLCRAHRRPPGCDAPAAEREVEAPAEAGDPNLRSAQEVIGYYIAAQDGDLGHVEDLLVEDAAWKIRYIVVDTRNWLPGRKVLVSPQWLREVNWAERTIALDLPARGSRTARSTTRAERSIAASKTPCTGTTAVRSTGRRNRPVKRKLGSLDHHAGRAER